MKLLPLTQGFKAIVDDDVYEWASKYSCHVHEGHRPYPKLRIDGKLVRLSRVIMNAPDGMDVDHITGNVLDNRRENLRVVTHSMNMRNQKKSHVHFDKYNDKWRARIPGEVYKRIHLGYFKTKEEAEEAVRSYL